MEYNNFDFNADKVKLYEAVRKTMPQIYEMTFFGHPVLTPLPASSEQITRSRWLKSSRNRRKLIKVALIFKKN